VLAALDRAERPLTRKEISERARVTDNSKLVLLLQELVEVARIVIRTDDNRYWLSSRTLP
jgi:DNA-binding IclR family transcriptional regulator